jgi:hypothetical protein
MPLGPPWTVTYVIRGATQICREIDAKRNFPQKRRSGAYGIRTRDLLNAIEALYQLS